MGLPRRQHVGVNTWVSAHKLECHRGKCGAAGGWEVKLCVPVYDITQYLCKFLEYVPKIISVSKGPGPEPVIPKFTIGGTDRVSEIYRRRSVFFTRRRGCYYFRAVSRALPKTRWSLPSILKPGRSKTALFCWEPPKEDLFSTGQKNVVNLGVPP